MSSLHPTSVDDADASFPVRTESTVSIPDPTVSIVTCPVAGAVQRYHTDAWLSGWHDAVLAHLVGSRRRWCRSSCRSTR